MIGAILAAAIATAQLPTVLGITLGQPLAMPECLKLPPTRLDQQTVYDMRDRATACWFTSADIAPDERRIAIPLTQWEQFPFLLNGVNVTILDGNVEEISMLTDGVRHQDDALQSVIDKFGQPSSRKVTSAQNGYGATYSVVTAEWSRSGYAVFFHGAEGQLDRGGIDVVTDVLVAKRAAEPPAKRPSL